MTIPTSPIASDDSKRHAHSLHGVAPRSLVWEQVVAAEFDGAQIVVAAADAVPAITHAFIAGQVACYGRFGVQGAHKQASTPGRMPGVYLVYAIRDGQLLGGMRIHQRIAGTRLQIEDAYADVGEFIKDLQTGVRGRPYVEMCALWTGEESRKTGLTTALVRVAMAVLPVLGSSHAVGFAHQHPRPLYERFGFAVDEGLGFRAYPDERYQSCVMRHAVDDLKRSAPVEYSDILRTRLAILQTLAGDETAPAVRN